MQGDGGRRGQSTLFIRFEFFGEEVEKNDRHLGVVFHGHKDRIPEVKSHIRTTRLIWEGKEYEKKQISGHDIWISVVEGNREFSCIIRRQFVDCSDDMA